MNNTAYVDGYMSKEAEEAPHIPYYKGLPGYNKGYLTDPGGRIAATYAADPSGYFPRGWDTQAAVNNPGVKKLMQEGEDIISRYPSITQVPGDIEKEYTKRFDKAVRTAVSRNPYNIPFTARQKEQIQKELPGVNVDTTGKEEPAYRPATKTLYLPQTGKRDGLSTAFHEYTHAVDPTVKPTIHWMEGTPEREMPAMVVERAVEASPYLPPEKRRPFTTMYGKQIEKFGPTLRGNFRGDLKRTRDWVHSMRRVPGVELQARKPFAYHGDTRTPQQRSKALGSAYQGWMNKQVGK